MTYQEALENIKNNYDAFFIMNKYGAGTHSAEFEKLSELKGDKVNNALAWIKHEYDCYYKDYYEKLNDTAFKYLEQLIKEQENE